MHKSEKKHTHVCPTPQGVSCAHRSFASMPVASLPPSDARRDSRLLAHASKRHPYERMGISTAFSSEGRSLGDIPLSSTSALGSSGVSFSSPGCCRGQCSWCLHCGTDCRSEGTDEGSRGHDDSLEGD